MIRVGLLLPFRDEGWLGGISYFRNLFRALECSRSGLLELVAFIGEDADAKLFADYPSVEVVRSTLFDRNSILGFLRRAEVRLARRDHLLHRVLRMHGISVLTHSGHLGPGADIPALGWVPDLQHLALPELFTPSEVAARTRIFRDYCRYCPRIIVSSMAAARDLRSIDGDCASKIRCLPFVADVPDSSELPSIAELEQKYRLPGPYVLFPAQFWAHKNHLVVVEALALLKSRGINVLVLATGNPDDYRQPEHFVRLMAQVRSLKLDAEFKVLGVIPHRDVMGLMANAVAALNPSLFEGWSTTVEEARSLGKRVIMSDIPVHREQAVTRGVYFPPKDAEALAKLLLWAVQSFDPTEERYHAEQARRELDARRAQYAKRFEEIVVEAVTMRAQREAAVRAKEA